MQITREVVVTEGPAPSTVLTLTMSGTNKVVCEPTREGIVTGDNSTLINVKASRDANIDTSAQGDVGITDNLRSTKPHDKGLARSTN